MFLRVICILSTIFIIYFAKKLGLFLFSPELIIICCNYTRALYFKSSINYIRFFLVKIQTVVKFNIILIFSKTISAGLLLKKPQGRFKETLPIKPYYILNGILRLLIYELFNIKFSKTIFP